jgi:hypothetical protein
MERESSSERALKLSRVAIQGYLTSLYGRRVVVSGVWRLGSEKGASEGLKGFGYGFPYVIEYRVGAKTCRAVLETMRPEGFGHDLPSDRAQILLWQHSAFGKLPKHVRSLDVGAFDVDGLGLRSLGKCGEFFILTDFVDGKLYHLDLDRIKETVHLEKLDERRCLALSNYLVGIHKVKREAPWLYVRRIRDLVGHGEGIMGLLDSYPPDLDFASESHLIDIERNCIVWRWLLKRKAHRLSQIHGDFHPWNVLFREGVDFTVLDRSRGEWGEPADDVAALTINYLFYSLQKYGELKGVFQRLFMNFWTNYLMKTEDQGVLEVVQPFYAWRGLVVASPLWYPHLEKDVRIKLLNFVKNVLQCDKFDPKDVNFYTTEA